MEHDTNMNVVEGYIKDEAFLQRILNLLSIVSKYLTQQNIDYFVVQGTLLGYKKYKSIMPWEIDGDLCAIASQKQIETEEFKKLMKDSGLEYKWKCDDTVLGIIYKNGDNFPRVDLALIEKKGDKLCRAEYCNKKPEPRWFLDNVHPSYIYPLKKIIMNGLELNIPNKTDEVLDIVYPNYKDRIVLYSYPGNKIELPWETDIPKTSSTFCYLTGLAIGASRYYLLNNKV